MLTYGIYRVAYLTVAQEVCNAVQSGMPFAEAIRRVKEKYQLNDKETYQIQYRIKSN